MPLSNTIVLKSPLNFNGLFLYATIICDHVNDDAHRLADHLQ